MSLQLQWLIKEKATQQQQHRHVAGDYKTYRRQEEVESDDSESDGENKYQDYYEEEDENTPSTAQALLLRRRRVILTDAVPPYEPPQPQRPTETATESYSSDDDVPTDWKHSNTKKRLIANMKNADSDIHLQINKDQTKANYQMIYNMYVNSNKFTYKRFQPNFKSLLKSFREKKGPFDPLLHDSAPTKWYTSTKQQSDGYILLKYLWRNRNDEMNSMTAEQVWNSHPVFQKYTLQKFKEYNYKWVKFIFRNHFHNAEISFSFDL